MSTKYQIRSADQPHFLTLTVVEWVDVFTRQQYRDILLDSIRFCQREKGLQLYGWCLMSNHVHLIASSDGRQPLGNILRDLKKFTSRQIVKAIEENPQESRKRWLLWLFRSNGTRNPNNEQYQFWQQDSHPQKLNNWQIMQQKLDYLHYNPVTAGLVEEPQYWLYSSASDYAGGKGLLEITAV